ncbi:unnamed protein product [Microthlaspi erraticum]|uniref:Uncharacterized protein n=1 Tax=Microthlaspi erraticum TaxID=1685480 RepID=A0A6D2HMN7_9BRAS|nr:unnamed protein product [Microthlaspi erraticum]
MMIPPSMVNQRFPIGKDDLGFPLFSPRMANLCALPRISLSLSISLCFSSTKRFPVAIIFFCYTVDGLSKASLLLRLWISLDADPRS